MKNKETLNEVALEFAKDHHEMYETNNFGAMHFGFSWGAKWQQERSYNDEDLRIAFVEGHNSARLRGSYKFNGTFEEDWVLWFKQFKKNKI